MLASIMFKYIIHRSCRMLIRDRTVSKPRPAGEIVSDVQLFHCVTIGG